MNKIFVFSAGCIRRSLDTIHLQNYFTVNGWQITKSAEDADVIIVATCGVVSLNEENSLKAIQEAQRRRKPGSKLIVTGCLPVISPVAVNKLGDCIFLPTKELDKIDTIVPGKVHFNDIEQPDSISDNKDIVNYLVARSICRKFRPYKLLFYNYFMNNAFLQASVDAMKLFYKMRNIFSDNKSFSYTPYYNVKISDGCLSYCTFCATKSATGRLKSRDKDAILKDFRRGLTKGYTTFQLVAEDTGCYGRDCGTNLGELLDALCSHEGDFKLVIIDCCPQWLIEDKESFLPVIKKHKNKIKEFFIHMQSGSNEILKRMGREYTAEDAIDILKQIQAADPSILIRSNVLIGFPGETDADFALTKELVSQVKFAEITVNRYEDRPTTESAIMSGKVPQNVIESRANELAALGCHILS